MCAETCQSSVASSASHGKQMIRTVESSWKSEIKPEPMDCPAVLCPSPYKRNCADGLVGLSD